MDFVVPRVDVRVERTGRQAALRVCAPRRIPPSAVWGYGALGAANAAQQAARFHAPAFTFEARSGVPLRVKWINDLKDAVTGEYLPPLFAVDQTLHWANPPGPRDTATSDPSRYTGPVPEVTHLHGGHTDEESDGYPEAWFLTDGSLFYPDSRAFFDGFTGPTSR